MNTISLIAIGTLFVALSLRHALNRAQVYRALGLGSCAGGILCLLIESLSSPEGAVSPGYLLPALAHLVVAFLCYLAIPRRALERVEAPLLFIAQALFGIVITTPVLPLFVGCFAALSMLLGFFALQESRRHTADGKRHLRVNLFLLFRVVSLVCLLIVWGSLWGTDLTFERLPSISGIGKWALLALIFSSMGLFPFHGWLAPFLSAPRLNLFVPVMSLELGMVVFFRIFIPLQPVLDSVTWVVAAAAAAGMVYSALLLFGETRLKRTVSYLVMTHLSLLVLCVLSGGQEGVVGARLDGVNVLIAASGLCTILAFLNARYGIEGVLTPSGLVSQYPEMGICFLICTLSLVGFPGTMGYITEELVLKGGLEYRIILLPIVVMAMALNSYSCFRIFARTFFGSAMYVTSPVLALSIRERVALLSIAGLLLGAGLLPEFIKVLVGVGSLAG